MKRFRLGIGLVTASATLLFASTPAFADGDGEVAPGPTVDVFELDADVLDSGLEGQFTSLAGALLALQAKQAGMTLDSYLKANDLKVAQTGRGGSQLVQGSLKGQKTVSLKGSSPQELSTELLSAGFGLDTRNYRSLSDMASDVLAKAHTADGAVTLAGAAWVADLKNLRPGNLTMPTVGSPSMPGIPKEALPFGLLLDKGIAGTVLNAPDLFAQVTQSGVGSPELSKVFSTELQKAWGENGKSLMDALPSKCTGLMMEIMATGNTGRAGEYADCQPSCVTGGVYLHSQSKRLFTTGAEQIKPNLTDGFWNYETLMQAQDWRIADVVEQNPAVVQGLLSTQTDGAAAALCDDASTSTKSALQDTLPGIFGQLRKK